jgi:integrase
MPLTNLVASNTKPRSDGKQLKLFDSGGLFLLITPAGGKYWRMKYRWAGKEKLLALGVFPEVSLKDARSKRDAARRLLDENIDPSTKRRNDRLAAKVAAESSFKALALEWHRTKASGWAPRHAESVLKSLETYLFPDLGALPVAEIEPMALLEVLRKIERTGKLDTAKRLRERTQAIFRLAIQTGRARHNPAAELTDALQAAVVQPRPALALQQLPGFLSKLKATDLTPHTRVLFAVIMVCFTRIGETVRARWEDLDLERGIWVIPPENRKLQHKLKTSAPPHIVPIPRQIVLAFTSLLPLRGAGPFVFQNHHFPRRHMSESTPRKVLERMGYGGKDRRHGNVVTHGFRATASTILNEAGFNPDAVERQLSHIEQNQVRAAYNRAQYMDERRQMLQCWADYLDTLGASGQIVPLLGSRSLPSIT